MLRVAVRPRFLGLLALMVAATLVCGLLATWQWDRAHRAITSRSSPTDVAVPLEEALPLGGAVTNEVSGDPVLAGGTFAIQEQVLVPDRRIDGTTAVIVVTALHVEQEGGGEARLPVARGWIPQADVTGPDGSLDPALVPAAPSGHVEIRGLLEASEAATGGIEDGIVHEIATPLLVNAWGEPMYAGYLAQTSAAEGLSPMPSAQSSFQAGLDWQNLGYAAQWVLFGAFFLYLWWRSVRTAYLDERADELTRLSARLDAAAAGSSENPIDQKDVTGVDPDSATTR
ncbi:SURF1 family protein [Brachybacterium hainanense]|uniref:SURF1-like protein n=1 Tax=Brachybacterium hainanense TaxID=1541174 RepID=A0ABV6RE73_9MICO